MRKLITATLYSSAGTLSTLLFGAVVIKILALINGAEGVGLFSILRQLQQTLVIVALLGGQTAIVQGLASLEGEKRDNFLVATLKISLVTTGITVLLIVLAAPLLNHWLFAGQVAAGLQLIYWSIIPLICGSIFSYLCSVLNGYRAVGSQALLQLCGALLGACIAYPLALGFKSGFSYNYVLLLAAPFALGAILALIYCCKKGFLKPFLNRKAWSFAHNESRYFLAFASVTLITSLLQTAVLLAIRGLILKNYDMAAVGKFDAAWTLSMMYIMLILNSIAMFYLPELSKIKDYLQRQILIDNVIRLAIVILLPLITFVLEFKYYYIVVFYSREFLPSIDMIQWMILGDFFKVFGWIFAVSMLAYARMKPFFFSELLWHSAFLGLAYTILHRHLPLQYIGLVFFILYVAYFIFCTVYIHRCWQFKLQKKYVFILLLSFSYLLMILLSSWNDYSVNWLRGSLSLVVSLFMSAIFWFYTADKSSKKLSAKFLFGTKA